MENKIRVNVYLSQEAIDLLDVKSKEQDISRSALLQRLALGLKHNSHTTKVTRSVLVEELNGLFENIKEIMEGSGKHKLNTKEVRRIVKEEISEAFPND